VGSAPLCLVLLLILAGPVKIDHAGDEGSGRVPPGGLGGVPLLSVQLPVAAGATSPGRATEQVTMKRVLWPLAVVIVPAILGAARLVVAYAGPPAPAAPPDKIAALRPAASPSPAPAITSTPSGRPRAALTSRRAARPRPQLTGPWAVVSAYYRAVDSHKYAQAWALISSGLATGQTY
jgi:hypothetical protein